MMGRVGFLQTTTTPNYWREIEMAEYIERQAAIEALGEEPEIWCETDEEAATRNQWERDKVAIEAVPPADVRPVVFCRDCFANGLCSVQDALFDNDLDKAEGFYCANGRREEEDG